MEFFSAVDELCLSSLRTENLDGYAHQVISEVRSVCVFLNFKKYCMVMACWYRRVQVAVYNGSSCNQEIDLAMSDALNVVGFHSALPTLYKKMASRVLEKWFPTLACEIRNRNS